MIRFEFHRRPLSLLVIRKIPVEGGVRGYTWRRAIGLRVGYFPERDCLGARLLLWRRSVGFWLGTDRTTRHFLRTEPMLALRHAPIFWRRLNLSFGVSRGAF